jgi:hypothetical protein
MMSAAGDNHPDHPPHGLNLGQPLQQQQQQYIAGLSFIIQNEKEVVRKKSFLVQLL